MDRYPWMPVKSPRLMKVGVLLVCWLCGMTLSAAQNSKGTAEPASKAHKSNRYRSPSAARAKAKPANQSYIIRQGDTLFSVARAHSMTVRELMAVNGLKTTRLKAGQELRLSAVDRRAPERSSGSGTLAELATTMRTDRPNPFSLETLATSITASEILSRQRADSAGEAADKTGETTAAALETPSTLRFQLVSEGLNLLGVRYRWRGISEETGFDCSGLVTRLFDQFGISLPHSAREQFKLGTQIPAKDLQVGDLVFFGGRSKIPTHVGIYIGEGCILHAISGARRVVVSHLEHDWYKRRYLGARRIPELWTPAPTIIESKADADSSN